MLRVFSAVLLLSSASVLAGERAVWRGSAELHKFID